MAESSNSGDRELFQLLQRLIATPSVNPGSRESFEAPFGEGRMAALLEAIVSPWGAETSAREVKPGRVSFVAKFGGADSSRSLMLEAHADTVGIEGMTVAPFEPAVRDGRMYGRGACDTKGSMAAMLLAIRRVLDEDGPPPVDVYFVSTCNEEAGADGAAALMAEGFRADAAVVGEPTDLSIIHAHKGIVRWAISTHGRAAHSSAPDQGASAISMMAKVIAAIDGPVAGALAEKHHPLLGEPTVSIGTIRGGTQTNVVPDGCTIEVDRRVLPSETAEEATREVRARLDALAKAEKDFRYTLVETQRYPPFDEDVDSPVSRCAAAACEKVLGKATFAVAPWGANAGIFKHAGIPCVILGPGSIRQAHTADEYVELAQVAKAIDVYAHIIRNAPA